MSNDINELVYKIIEELDRVYPLSDHQITLDEHRQRFLDVSIGKLAIVGTSMDIIQKLQNYLRACNGFIPLGNLGTAAEMTRGIQIQPVLDAYEAISFISADFKEKIIGDAFDAVFAAREDRPRLKTQSTAMNQEDFDAMMAGYRKALGLAVSDVEEGKQAVIGRLSDINVEHQKIVHLRGQVEKVIVELRSQSNAIKETISGLQQESAALAAARNSNISDYEDALSDQLGNFRTEYNELVKTLESTRDNLFVADASRLFEGRQKSHRDVADAYLAGAIFFGALGLIFVGWAFFNPVEFQESQHVALIFITRVFPRITIIGLLLSLAYWCNARSKINRHLELQNEHKLTALKTVIDIHKVTPDRPGVREAVLLQAAHLIFSKPQTGFESGAQDDAIMATKLIDLVTSTKSQS